MKMRGKKKNPKNSWKRCLYAVKRCNLTEKQYLICLNDLFVFLNLQVNTTLYNNRLNNNSSSNNKRPLIWQPQMPLLPNKCLLVMRITLATKWAWVCRVTPKHPRVMYTNPKLWLSLAPELHRLSFKNRLTALGML